MGLKIDGNDDWSPQKLQWAGEDISEHNIKGSQDSGFKTPSSSSAESLTIMQKKNTGQNQQKYPACSECLNLSSNDSKIKRVKVNIYIPSDKLNHRHSDSCGKLGNQSSKNIHSEKQVQPIACSTHKLEYSRALSINDYQDNEVEEKEEDHTEEVTNHYDSFKIKQNYGKIKNVNGDEATVIEQMVTERFKKPLDEYFIRRRNYSRDTSVLGVSCAENKSSDYLSGLYGKVCHIYLYCKDCGIVMLI